MKFLVHLSVNGNSENGLTFPQFSYILYMQVEIRCILV